MAEADLRHLVKYSKRAEVRRKAFEELVRRRLDGADIKISKAFEANFQFPVAEVDQPIASAIEAFTAKQRAEWEESMAQQRARLEAAERSLGTKETKKALNDKRVSTNKIEWFTKRLADLDRREPKPGDGRIFPMWYTPIIVGMDGEHVILPARYHCRQNGKPPSIDKQYDGLYNARRDSLDGYWKNLFGKRHAILVAHSFYENVSLHTSEHRELAPGEKEQNLVLHFHPRTGGPMLLACLWDCWQKEGEPDLYSFAAITDEPPIEVRAAGHDRCVIPLKAKHIDAWLSPEGRSLEELYAILDDRERPYYEHERLAA